MLTKIQKLYYGVGFAVLGLMFAIPGLCAPASTSEEVVDGVVGAGIDSAVTLVTHMVTTYFPYLIAFAVIAVIFTKLWGFVKVGSK